MYAVNGTAVQILRRPLLILETLDISHLSAYGIYGAQKNNETHFSAITTVYLSQYLSLRLAIPLCVCDKYHTVSTVKHNSCIFYYVKIFLHDQHVSTQLMGNHQAGILIKFELAVHKELAYANSLCIGIFSFITIPA
jgi:hypothetical protein